MMNEEQKNSKNIYDRSLSDISMLRVARSNTSTAGG